MNVHVVSQAWRVLLAYNSALQPVRVGLIIGVLMPVVFLLVPQGRDIAVALGEIRWSDPEWWRVFWFFVALTVFGLTNWFGPRFLLDCDFKLGGAQREALKGHERVLEWLESHVPRFLGALPIFALGVEYLFLWVEHGALPDDQSSYGVLCLGCFALALALYAFFIAHARVLEKVRAWRGFSAPPRYRNLREVAADKLALLAFGAFMAPSVLLFLLFTFRPVPSGLLLGSGSVLVFALASWSCLGAIVVYLGHRWGLPTLTFGACWLLLASCWNDNHAVRTLAEGPRAIVRPKLETHLAEWRSDVTTRFPGEQTHPLFIVITEGGGIRAAYWTTRVLAEIEDRAQKEFPEWATARDGKPNFVFADHLLAISGVSGGSLGAATFNVLLQDSASRALGPRVKDVLGQEFLAPLVGKMMFPDCAQRFIPFPVTPLDRARALEEGWEVSWTKYCPGYEPAFAAYFQPARRLPALFFNGTDVERGGRIVTSTVDFVGTPRAFTSARDGNALMDGGAMRLSTAVHSSARFTYFSPAGRFPSGRHIVDGGYFENSGASTGHDLLRTVRAHGWADVQPIVIVITNGSPGDFFKKDWASREVTTPLDTLFATRPAHSTASALELIAGLYNGRGAPVRRNFAFNMSDPGVPLGWTLSPRAVEAMEKQIGKNDAEFREIFATMRTLRDLSPASVRASE